MANPYDQFDQTGGVFVPAPGAAEREAREQRGEGREKERIDITRTAEDRQEKESKRNAIKQLSDAFNGQKPVQDYQTALPAYATIVELAAKPASKANDNMIITMYNKVQDPGSAVLEGERRSAQDVGTLYDKYSTQLQGLFDPETGFVSDAARKQFIQSTETLIEERRRAYDFMRRRYSDVAQSDTYKLDPMLVVGPDFSADYDPVILENWNKLFPPQTQAELRVAEGDRFSTDQEIAIARQLQDAWNQGSTPEQMNALAQQLTGQPFGDEELRVMQEMQGQPLTIAPTKTGVREAGEQISEGLGGELQSAAMGAVTGYLANMPEELADLAGMDPRQVQAAREAYQEANPLASFGGEIIGGVLSPVAKLGGRVAAPVAGRLASPVASAVTRGAVEGGIYGGVYGAGEAAPGAPLEERAIGAGLGTLAGVFGGTLGGAAVQRISARPAIDDIPGALDISRQVIQAGEREGVPVMTSDIRPPKTWMGRWSQAMGEKIPFVGTAGPRAAQQEAREAAIGKLYDEYNAGDASIDKVTSDFMQTRKDQIGKYTQQKKEVFAKLSGQPVDMTRTLEAIDSAIAKYSGTDTYLPLVGQLEKWRADIVSGDINTVELMRKAIGDSIDDQSMTSVRSELRNTANSIYGPLKEDMGEHIKEFGSPADFLKWQDANKNLADFAEELEKSTLNRILRTGDATPEEAASLLFSKKPSDIRALYENLSENGKSNARSLAIREIVEKAGGLDELSTAKFKTQLKNAGKQIGIVFKKEEADRLEGMLRLYQATKQAEKAALVTPTGQMTLPFLAGLASYFTGPLAAAGVAAAGGATRAYESKAMRNLLVKLSSTEPGSRGESNVLKMIGSTLSKVPQATAAPAAANLSPETPSIEVPQ